MIPGGPPAHLLADREKVSSFPFSRGPSSRRGARPSKHTREEIKGAFWESPRAPWVNALQGRARPCRCGSGRASRHVGAVFASTYKVSFKTVAFALFVLLAGFFSPPGFGHASSPFHFEEPLDAPAAAKPLADLDVGEPRTVRMIYFLPNDRPFRQEIVDSMKVVIGRVQTFFAEQMQAHGYGNKTFRFETDASGEPVVHRLDGKHPSHQYTRGPVDEISEVFDLRSNVYSIVTDFGGSGCGGAGERRGKSGGYGRIHEPCIGYPPGYYAWITAHELGHAFGLWHDFRDENYLMSYGLNIVSHPDRLSASAAEFLSVHPYFNSAIPLEEGPPPTVELLSPVRYPAGSKSVSVRLNVRDPAGIHQVCLHILRGSSYEVKACRSVAGEKEAVVEFEYDGVIPATSWFVPPPTSLSQPAVHIIQIMAVDTEGNAKGAVDLRAQGWIYRLLEISPYEIASLEGYSPSVHSLAFSPDGALLAFPYREDDPTVRLWDVAAQEPVATLDPGQSVAFSPDGTLAVGSRNYTSLWDVANRKKIVTLEQGGHSGVTFSSDGSLLATATESTVRLWDVAKRTEVGQLDAALAGVIGAGTPLAFSPDGALLASLFGQGTVRLWDVSTQEPVATLDGDLTESTSVAFSPDGTTLASGHFAVDRTVALWDVETREQVAIFEREGSGWVMAVAFSPDGRVLASAGSLDNTVRLWDVRTRQELAAFEYIGSFFSVAFSPDGATLAAGTPAAVLLWDVTELLRVPEGLEILSGHDQQAAAGAALTAPFLVEVTDQKGQPVEGVQVTFSITAGGGTLSVETATTDSVGRAASTLTLGPDPGPNTVTAIVAGLDPVTFSAAGSAIPHTLTKLSGQDQQGPAGTALPRAVRGRGPGSKQHPARRRPGHLRGLRRRRNPFGNHGHHRCQTASPLSP